MMQLRPTKLIEVVGNTNLKKCLEINLKAAKIQNRPLPHILFQGASGCGKTTFAYVLAQEMGVDFIETNASAIKKYKDIIDFVARLKKLKPNSILFIDEIHALKRKFNEALYPVMEEFKIPLTWSDLDGTEESLMLTLPPFTLIGATTDIGNITGPLLNRFKQNYFVSLYETEEIKKLVEINAEKLKLKLVGNAAALIANRSKKTPRVANSRLEWIRDFAIFINQTYIEEKHVLEAMSLYEINEYGHDRNDVAYIQALEEMGVAGLQTLAARLNMSPEAIQKYIEPYLLDTKVLSITPSGRTLIKPWNTMTLSKVLESYS